MAEFVAIPKDLFEKMVDAVLDLQKMLDRVEDEDEIEVGTSYDKVTALYEEIEEAWPDRSFAYEVLMQAPGRKWVRQKKLSGAE